MKKQTTLADFDFYCDNAGYGYSAILRNQTPEVNGLEVKIFMGHRPKDIIDAPFGACESSIITDMYLDACATKVSLKDVEMNHPKMIRYLLRKIELKQPLV